MTTASQAMVSPVKAACRILASLAVLIATAAEAQQSGEQRSDSTRLYQLDALIVTAERRAAAVALSTSAVSVLNGDELRATPTRTLAEALRQAPGIAFVDFDGLGFDPQVMTRGFYGGGEAEHITLLVNGRPLNALETGRAPWDLIPVSSIESIEVVRGSGSAAWGDAAMGGVINVITRRDGASAGRVSVAGGSHGVVRGDISLSGNWNGMPGSVFANVTTADGSREHAGRRSGGFGATLGLIDTDRRGLELSTLNDWRGYDEPGPLTGAALSEERTQSLPFYRFDEVEERYHRVALDGRTTVGTGSTLTASLTGDYRHSDRVRTVPLAPVFADTKARVLSTARLIGSTQLQLGGLLSVDDELMVGADASAGRIESRYHDYLMGSPDVYANADASRGDVVASGKGWRNAAAGFLAYSVDISPAVRFTTGARLDWLRDSFDDDAADATEERSTSHVAFSPRAGLNIRYLNDARQQGRVYFSVARSFKAPTPDQLFDQRTFPVEFPPFQIGFANEALEPQYGTSYEAGIYHRADLVPGALAAELTLSAYHMDIRDEIDFDIGTFRYQNIGKSRHRGIEAGIDLRAVQPYSAFVRYTLQAATSRVEGDTFGKSLKAIPRHFMVVGARAGREDAGPAASLTATTARRMWLDDVNTRRLPRWTRWDARVSWAVRSFFCGGCSTTIYADMYNLFDSEYSTTGFPDSADPSTVHYYPAAGRTLYIGFSRSWP